MKDRLLKLLQEADRRCSNTKQCKDCVGYGKGDECVNYLIADHLLANGVIVQPCKVGDTIYRKSDPIKKVYEWQIEHIEIYEDEIVFIDDSDNNFTAEDIGKTVFLAREEAERALKGGAE